MTAAPIEELRRFIASNDFRRSGAVITDLDGTAVLEREGRIFLPPEVEAGLRRIHAHGRPVIANTLRFPRSVIDVFGDEWHRATGADLPLVSLKGAQLGCIVRDRSGKATFDEWQAETLSAAEVAEIMQGVEGMVDDGVDDLLVFFYPRDWRRGELIWTPDARRVQQVQEKYRSASAVTTSPVRTLHEQLLAMPLCMVFLLVGRPHDRLMAYQHTQRNSFFVHQGVSKRSGAQGIAARMGIDLAMSIGAGDAPPDDFLEVTGFSIIVGAGNVDYKGLEHTVRVASIAEFGQLLDAIDAELP